MGLFIGIGVKTCSFTLHKHVSWIEQAHLFQYWPMKKVINVHQPFVFSSLVSIYKFLEIPYFYMRPSFQTLLNVSKISEKIPWISRPWLHNLYILRVRQVNTLVNTLIRWSIHVPFGLRLGWFEISAFFSVKS